MASPGGLGRVLSAGIQVSCQLCWLFGHLQVSVSSCFPQLISAQACLVSYARLRSDVCHRILQRREHACLRCPKSLVGCGVLTKLKGKKHFKKSLTMSWFRLKMKLSNKPFHGPYFRCFLKIFSSEQVSEYSWSYLKTAANSRIN